MDENSPIDNKAYPPCGVFLITLMLHLALRAKSTWNIKKMGLLKFESEPEFGKLAEYVSACQPCGAFEAKGFCAPEKRLFREYTGFTVDFLYASMQLDDKKIFEDYVLWFYELLCPVMADMPKHRVSALLLSHFSVVENGAEQIFADREVLDSFWSRIQNRWFLPAGSFGEKSTYLCLSQ